MRKRQRGTPRIGNSRERAREGERKEGARERGRKGGKEDGSNYAPHIHHLTSNGLVDSHQLPDHYLPGYLIPGYFGQHNFLEAIY